MKSALQNTMNNPQDPGPFTAEQLDELGIAHEEPPIFTCEHCGALLPSHCYVLFGKTAWVPCGECQCEGAIREREGERRRAQADAAKQRRRELERIGIEPRYQSACVCREEIVSFLASFDRNNGNSLFIHGISGSGKTSLCSAIARDLHDAGHDAVLVNACEMLEAIQETFDKKTSTKKAIERFMSCELLLIDDMGRESGSEWAVQMIYRILNKRYGCLRPTVIASEYKLSSLGVRMSRKCEPERIDAILSRIKHVYTYVKLPNVDYRIQKNGFPVQQ